MKDSDKKPNLHERVEAGLDRELKRQKFAGKQFLSDEEIDKLVDKIIKEELGDKWKETYTNGPKSVSIKESLLKFEAELEAKATLITEAVGDVILIASMNNEKTAMELIRTQFIVIDRQDLDED